MPDWDAYPTFPLNCIWFFPSSEVDSAKAVPRPASLPKEVTRPPSPADTLTSARVSEKISLDARCCGPLSSIFHPGSSRNTGRVAFDVRSTHFQSSLMMARCSGVGFTSWIELNSPAKLMFNSVRNPGCTKILLLETGEKLARETRIEYTPAARPSKAKDPFSSVSARSQSRSCWLRSRMPAPICGTPAASVTKPSTLPESLPIGPMLAAGDEPGMESSPSTASATMRRLPGLGIFGASLILRTSQGQ